MTRRSIFLGLVIAAAFIPTAFQLYNIYAAKSALEIKQVYRLPITGFDPRDFSRGRFATVQVDWKPEIRHSQCLSGSKPLSNQYHYCSLCLKKISAEETAVTLFDPHIKGADAGCDEVLPSVRSWSASTSADTMFWVEGGNSRNLRFYLDERLADHVDEALRERTHNFSADVVFSGPNTLILRELYIDGIPHRKFIENKAR